MKYGFFYGSKKIKENIYAFIWKYEKLLRTLQSNQSETQTNNDMDFTNESLAITVESIFSSDNIWKRSNVNSYFIEYYTFVTQTDDSDIYVFLVIYGNGAYNYTLSKGENKLSFSNRTDRNNEKQFKQFTSGDMKLIDAEIQKLKFFL